MHHAAGLLSFVTRRSELFHKIGQSFAVALLIIGIGLGQATPVFAQQQILGINSNYGNAPESLKRTMGIYFTCGGDTGGSGSSSTSTTSNTSSTSTNGVTWPFATKAPSQYQRVDQGWDIQNSPGSPVYAIAPGTIHKTNPDPGGFGNDYPTEELDNSIGGPSNWVYYGHVHVLPDVMDKHVNAGQQIAVTNTTDPQNGSAAPTGWLEIGFALPKTGAPIQRGGEGAATQAGQTMKSILLTGSPGPGGAAGTTSSGSTCCDTSTTSSTTATANAPIDFTMQDSSRNRTIGVSLYLPSDTNLHPLVIFAPGRDQNSKSDGFYARYLKAIAAQGFIVAGVNFSDNHSYQAIPADAGDLDFLVKNLPSDNHVSKVIDGNKGIAIIGHSDGGYAALISGYSSQRTSNVSAIIAEDAGLYQGMSFTGNGAPPLLLMHGSADTIEPPASSDAIYTTITPSYKAYAKFIGADHHSYITGGPSVQQGPLNGKDLSSYNPAVDAITGAFLKRQLGVDGSDQTKLSTVVQQFKSEVSLEESGTDVAQNGNSGSVSANNPVTSSTSNPACCPPNSSTDIPNILTSADKEQVKAATFSYLTTHGFSAIQAAAIMGSIQSESAGTWNPRVLQTSPLSYGDYPTNGQGFGLVQWTYTSRQQPLVDRAKAAGKLPSDLGVQLDYIRYELTEGPYKSVGDQLKTINDIAAANDLVVRSYETPADIAGNIPIRLGYSRAILAEFGSGASGGSAATGGLDPASSVGCNGGTSSIDTTLPQGDKDQLIQQILATKHVVYGASNLTTAIRRTTLAMLLRLAQKYTFYITQGAHLNGTAVDIQNINGNQVPFGNNYPTDYAKINSDADKFETDVANLEPQGNSWLGVPNQHYMDLANNILRSKGGTAGLDTPPTTNATGSHFHVACPPDAP